MKLFRDPLVGFLLAGAVIFAIDRWHSAADDTKVIEITAAQVQRISDQWQTQTGRAPEREELDGLVEAWIREEIYYRQALSMGLEVNDTIVRRRLVQKLSFLTEDLVDMAPVTDEELLAFYDKSPQAYTEAETFSFEHRYFSGEMRDDPEGDARNAIAADNPVGDPFMLQQRYVNRSQREVGDLFGRDFAAALTTLSESSQWQGPIRSAFGWHLVRLIKREPQRLLPFDQVADRVAADLQENRRRIANEAFYQELRSGYEIRGVGEEK